MCSSGVYCSGGLAVAGVDWSSLARHERVEIARRAVALIAHEFQHLTTLAYEHNL